MEVDVTQRRVKDQALYQCFCWALNGIKVELNFIAAEVNGVEEELLSEDSLSVNSKSDS